MADHADEARGGADMAGLGHGREPASTAVVTASGGPQLVKPPAGGLIGVYTGWLGNDNLGDEIVSDIFLDLLAAAVIEATGGGTCVTLERESRALARSGWRGCTLANVSGACDFGILGGGSTVSMDYVRRIAGVLQAGRHVLLFGSGYQSGFTPKKELRDKYLGLLCKGRLSGGVRGPLSMEHLQQFGCTGRRAVSHIGDSGFLADMLYRGAGGSSSTGSTSNTGRAGGVGSTGGDGGVGSTGGDGGVGRASGAVGGTGSMAALLDEIRAQRAQRRHVVVVTLKPAFLPLLKATVQALLERGDVAVVLQAVDEDSARLHAVYAINVNQRLPPGAPPVLLHQEYNDWAAVLDLYRHASASLNSRLHSGVLSASALTPTIFVANNDKFADFRASLNTNTTLYIAAGWASESREQGTLAATTAAATLQQQQQQVEPHEALADSVVQVIQRAGSLRPRLRQLQQETMCRYRAIMADFLLRLERQDPARLRATLCCKHVRIVRSTSNDKRVLIKAECAEPLADQSSCQLSLQQQPWQGCPRREVAARE